MVDYFKNISDWRDKDERPPKIYLEFEDVLEYKGSKYRFHYIERDWNMMGDEKPPSERCCVIEINRKDMLVKAKNVSTCTISWGSSFKEALERIKGIIDFYLKFKDMTREEFDEWRK